jgi:predicted flavoprotein YhiN
LHSGFGAGVAGITAAIRAAESGAQVTLLNAHPRVGLKIFMSSGRGSRSFLGARLPERIADMLTAESGLGGVAMSQTPKQRRAQMLALVMERDLEVVGTLGYEKAEVTAGGVPLSEVGSSTLESRVVPGLYLCGEVLDVEGRLGGFNFQWTWSSGTVAGGSAGSRLAL